MTSTTPGRRSGRTTPTTQRSARRRGRNKHNQQQQKERLEKVRQWVSIERQYGNCGLGVRLWVPLEQLTPIERDDYEARLLQEKTKELQQETAVDCTNDETLAKKMIIPKDNQDQLTAVVGETKVVGSIPQPLAEGNSNTVHSETIEVATKKSDILDISMMQSCQPGTPKIDQLDKKSSSADMATVAILALNESPSKPNAEDLGITARTTEVKDDKELEPQTKKAKLET
eukprot:CAMPEP_0194217102 /NCGR_PEP_ID=MMETSP0156-20130528/20365_1 /TAXON_ID=33649 /ORGANISM="Thalassionema nitzschioides, Strain L26-B" /LENGTH=228 /DNA_ID=CAMNT_0038946047 /DNA_START=48 /DNA_END=734 /DNA_ORIENTATION=+